jgi:hypothetical protein
MGTGRCANGDHNDDQRPCCEPPALSRCVGASKDLRFHEHNFQRITTPKSRVVDQAAHELLSRVPFGIPNGQGQLNWRNWKMVTQTHTHKRSRPTPAYLLTRRSVLGRSGTRPAHSPSAMLPCSTASANLPALVLQTNGTRSSRLKESGNKSPRSLLCFSVRDRLKPVDTFAASSGCLCLCLDTRRPAHRLAQLD